MAITAINVFVEVDGQQCLAVIDHRMADLFMGMLGAYQAGQPNGARLSKLPDSATEHLLATRRAILEHIERQRAQASASRDCKRPECMSRGCFGHCMKESK